MISIYGHAGVNSYTHVFNKMVLLGVVVCGMSRVDTHHLHFIMPPSGAWGGGGGEGKGAYTPRFTQITVCSQTLQYMCLCYANHIGEATWCLSVPVRPELHYSNSTHVFCLDNDSLSYPVCARLPGVCTVAYDLHRV